MFRIWLAALAASIVCTAVSLAAPPIEAFGTLPTLADVRVSPDGTTIAYVREVDSKRVVVAHSLVTKQIIGMVNVSDAKLRNLQWADNHTLVITTSVTAKPAGITGGRFEYFMAQSFDVQTRKQFALLDRDSIRNENLLVMNAVIGVPQPRIIDGHTVVYVRGIFFANHVGRAGLFRVDLSDNATRLVSDRTKPHTTNWIVDARGNIVAESGYDEDTKHWKLDIVHGSTTTTVMDVLAPIESPSVEGLNEDGTALIVDQLGDDGHVTWNRIPLSDGSTHPWEVATVGFGDTLVSLSTGRTIGGTRTVAMHNYVFFDPRVEKMWSDVKAIFKDAVDVNLESWSDDGTVVATHVFGPGYGEAYYVVDMNQHKKIQLGPAYTGIDTVATQRWIDYRASDGRVLHGYLTLPLGKEAKNLPLIVLPHGGPHSRDEPGFDWFSQSLASRGYVVLQPQFRGSDGFGLDLLSAGFGEFGKKMQTDLSDGVRALAAQGLIDPKRVCIVGASYGGYAALAGATLDTGVYRCAVSIAGISDIRTLLRYAHGPNSTPDTRGGRFWDRFLGIESLEDPKLDAIAPIKHIDRVTIPILLIHGKDDTVVPYAQSDDMADALKDAKKPYEFVTLKHEDHWLSNSETRVQMLEATVKFLETNNPPN